MNKKSNIGIIILILILLIFITIGICYLINPNMFNITKLANNEVNSNNTNTIVQNTSTNTIIENAVSNTTNTTIENTVNNTNEPTVTVSTDLFGKYYPQAEEKLKTMSLEEKVGQMFFVRCPEDNQSEMIKTLNPGGFILFGRDFKAKTKSEVINNISSYQNASKIPMLIGVDEEGGSVVRVSSNKNLRSEEFNSPRILISTWWFF